MSDPKTAAEARDAAITWQHWAGEQNLSWGELIDHQAYFTALGEQFDLTEEFRENGII